MALTIRRTPLHFLASLLLIPFIAITSAKASKSDDHWVGTWSSAPVSANNTNSHFSDDTTLREIVHVSIGGKSVRIVLSNAFGATRLKIGGANVALSGTGGAIKGTAVPALFHGQPTVEIPAGAEVVSDPIALDLQPLSDLAVTIFVPGQTVATITQHGFADADQLPARGNQLASADFAGATHPALLAVPQNRRSPRYLLRRRCHRCLGRQHHRRRPQHP